MASFHIHQDHREKENVVHANCGKQKTNQEEKEKRPTLAVLSNVTHGIGQQGKVVFGKSGKGNNEKQILTNVQQKKVIISSTKVSTEQTKSFTVYQDVRASSTALTNAAAFIPKDKLAVNQKIAKNAEPSTSHESAICDDLVETSISSSEVLTPMSIDRSSVQIGEENIPPTCSKTKPKDHDKFFELDEYQKDILEYYREVEKKHRPKPAYMQKQHDINYSMRRILVDWLVEVSEEYRLHTETLYLAVSYIDRFLSYMSVVRAKLQLVGTAAMFIAAKFEEIYPPDVGEFVFITDDTYTKVQVLRMEQVILKILSFDLNTPSPVVFMNMFSILYVIPSQVKYLAIYLSELTLLEGEPFLQYLPSQISSASLALSRHILNLPIWCLELETITTYSLKDLKKIILEMNQLHNSSIELAQQAIQEKYKSNKYMQVSTIKPVELTKDQMNYLIKEYETTEKHEKSLNKSLSYD